MRCPLDVCTQVSPVANSMPPRDSSPTDQVRQGICLVVLLALLTLSSLNITELFSLVLFLSFFLIAINCLTIEQVANNRFAFDPHTS